MKQEKDKKELYWIWSSKIPEVGPILWKRLLEEFSDMETIFASSSKDLEKVKGIGRKTAEKIGDPKYKQHLEKQVEELKKRKIKVIGITDSDYPEKLKSIYDPPICLYVRGNSKLLQEKSIAMVGSRNPSNTGKKVARKLAYDLAKLHIHVVSGMARGIDAESHIGCLLGQGKTIAVLGSGIDVIYPKENRVIYQEILKRGGTIVSEYGMGIPPNPYYFPARNRIISGLSDGVVVVEAAEKSGSLITADFALDQGKEVFAVPGDLDKITTKGTNQLLKEGAKLVTNVEDLLS